MKVFSIVGARPNFMKVAPFLRQSGIEHVLVHTGQHFSYMMSDQFFHELGIRSPDYNLGACGTPGQQLGAVISGLEPILEREKPDWVVLYGDVNAVCAGAIISIRMGCKVAHVEAGLRADDVTMPEEQNRLVADRLSTKLFTTCRRDIEFLQREGRKREDIEVVGNIMIDTLEHEREAASRLSVNDIFGNEILGKDEEFAILTLHRPSNVDNSETLRGILKAIKDSDVPRVIFPVHPRTWIILCKSGILSEFQDKRIHFTLPISYREMLKLNMEAKVMITDSGGLQEESCVLGTPCVVIRNNTERHMTLHVHGGTSLLAGNDPDRIKEWIKVALFMKKVPKIPFLWDGCTAERIANYLQK